MIYKVKLNILVYSSTLTGQQVWHLGDVRSRLEGRVNDCVYERRTV